MTEIRIETPRSISIAETTTTYFDGRPAKKQYTIQAYTKGKGITHLVAMNGPITRAHIEHNLGTILDQWFEDE